MNKDKLYIGAKYLNRQKYKRNSENILTIIQKNIQTENLQYYTKIILKFTWTTLNVKILVTKDISKNKVYILNFIREREISYN